NPWRTARDPGPILRAPESELLLGPGKKSPGPMLIVPALSNGTLMKTAAPGLPIRFSTAPAKFFTTGGAPLQLKICRPKLAKMLRVPALLSFDASPRQKSPSFHTVVPLRASVLPWRPCTAPLSVSVAVLLTVVVVAPSSTPPDHVKAPLAVNGPVTVPFTM